MVSYSALIRWRAAAEFGWEVDTRHPGFSTAEAAAMVANGLGVDGLEKLVLDRGVLFTVNRQGERQVTSGDVTIWTRPPTPAGLPEDMCFERAAESLAEMSATGRDGVFRMKLFRVINDDSGDDVEVKVAYAESSVVVVVRTPEAAKQDDFEVPRA